MENFNFTNDYEQIPFNTDIFADNPEPRCPCVLLLDTSGSMIGEPIDELNAGLLSFREELMEDPLARKRVEIAVISFGQNVTVQNDFHTAPHFIPPLLTASGRTPMGTAIHKAIELVDERKKVYKSEGISYYRPWIFLITDGEPTDDWFPAVKEIEDGEMNRSFSFFAVGVANANMNILNSISSRTPLKLKGLKFRELFQWLSNSMTSVSQSVPGENVKLSLPHGWAEI